MRRIHLVIAVALTLLVSQPSPYAKCPVDTLIVQGSIAESGEGPMEVAVVAHTPKGDFSGRTEASGGRFRVEVRFNTLKSWSPLLGHNCTNTPKAIDVKLSRGGQVLSEERLNFKGDFEATDLVTYRLKRELTLRAGSK